MFVLVLFCLFFVLFCVYNSKRVVFQNIIKIKPAIAFNGEKCWNAILKFVRNSDSSEERDRKLCIVNYVLLERFQLKDCKINWMQRT